MTHLHSLVSSNFKCKRQNTACLWAPTQHSGLLFTLVFPFKISCSFYIYSSTMTHKQNKTCYWNHPPPKHAHRPTVHFLAQTHVQCTLYLHTHTHTHTHTRTNTDLLCLPFSCMMLAVINQKSSKCIILFVAVVQKVHVYIYLWIRLNVIPIVLF